MPRRGGPDHLMGRAALLGAALAVLLASAACGSPGAGSARTPDGVPLVYGEGMLSKVPCQRGAHGAACFGLLTPPAGLHSSIVLKTRVRAGSTIRGAIVVTNTTSTTYRLHDAHGCRPDYQVALVNSKVAAIEGFAEICVSAPLVVPPGQNHYSVKVITTYPSCIPEPSDANPAEGIPLCTTSGGVPPLPPGRYAAVLIGQDLAFPVPHLTPIVTLTAPR